MLNTLPCQLSNAFEAAVRNLMYEPFQAKASMSAAMLFKSYFWLPSELINYLCCAFDLRTEWFASALDRNTLLPFYASKGRADDGFSSLGNAYAFKWTGSGVVNPGLQTAQAIKAMWWAIASCYEPVPVLKLVLLPKPATSSCISICLQHPAAQCLLTLPRNACQFTVPELLHDACLVDECLPGPALQVVVVANQAELAMYMPAWPHLHAGL